MTRLRPNVPRPACALKRPGAFFPPSLGKLFVLSRYVEHCLAGEAVGDHLGDSPSFLRTLAPIFRGKLQLLGHRMGTVNVGGSPSYVELLICLEMMQDSRKHQQEEQAKSRKPAGKT